MSVSSDDYDDPHNEKYETDFFHFLKIFYFREPLRYGGKKQLQKVEIDKKNPKKIYVILEFK